MLSWFKKKFSKESSHDDAHLAPDQTAQDQTTSDDIFEQSKLQETQDILIPEDSAEQQAEQCSESPDAPFDPQECLEPDPVETESAEPDQHLDESCKPELSETETVQPEISLPDPEIPETNTLEAEQDIEPLATEQKEFEQTEETDTVETTDHQSAPEPAPMMVTPAKPRTEQEKKKSFFSRLSEKLTRTRESFTNQIETLFLGKKVIDRELLDDLEEILITADLGVATSQEIIEYARAKVKRNELQNPEALKQALKNKILSYVTENQTDSSLVMPENGPFIIMVVGVNGVGKTTTIGKIAKKFNAAGQSVMLVAGDTFRAAAVSQLKIWGERNNVHVMAQKDGADPSSVAFDAIAHAKSKEYDVVLVDTAGRLHTSTNLMEELKKIKRVMAKQLPGAPHEILLVLDATTGQNAISQAKFFNEAVDITGIALTKLDGTAKGGILINICRELKLPVRFIGIGEQIDDLRDFNPEEFVEALFNNRNFS